ncbi:MAG: hypothetical protein AB7H93_24580 [Vicinamibacterales bacterium]
MRRRSGAQRRVWAAAATPLVQPAIAPGDVVRHWPTSTPGVWLVERISGADTTLARVAPDAIVTMRWAADCRVSRDERRRPAAAPPAFRDADLAALLAGRRDGALYFWSPHMPLSVDGYAHAVSAARARGLTVEPLLDPASNREFAAASLAAGALPASALRVADAVELQFRELTLHAPALLVFADGRLRGPVLPGYKTMDEYAAFLDRILATP